MFSVLAAVFLTQSPPPADPFAKWEKKVAAIEKRLKAKPPVPGGVVFAGSSSIRLWDLAKSFPDLNTVNAGFGGSQVPDSTHFAARLILPHKPRAVVFYAGDNDIAVGRKPGQVADDFTAFAAAVHKELPKAKILWVPIKPSISRWKMYETQSAANALVKAACEKDPRFVYVDTVPAMLGTDGTPRKELFVADGLHMSAKEYEIWAAAVTTALK